jgi:hypothetical protein
MKGCANVHAIKAIYDGLVFTPKQPIPVQGHYEVVITFIEPIPAQQENEPKRKINFGFLKDKLPPLPDSFFDPLPEEELELWGL